MTNNKYTLPKFPDKFAKQLKDAIEYFNTVSPDEKTKRILIKSWAQHKIQEMKAKEK